MSAALLERLTQEGLTLVPDGEQLRVKGTLTEELREEIRCHKQDLLCYLTWTTDPRPDLAEDSALWGKLLQMAYERDGLDANGAFGVLHGFRCWGCRLKETPAGYQLAPRYEAEGGGWTGPEEWRQDKETWLNPHKQAIRQLLAALTEEA